MNIKKIFCIYALYNKTDRHHVFNTFRIGSIIIVMTALTLIYNADDRMRVGVGIKADESGLGGWGVLKL